MASESTGIDYPAYPVPEMEMRPVYGHPMGPMQLPIPVHPGYGNMYDQNFLYGLPYDQGYPVYQQ